MDSDTEMVKLIAEVAQKHDVDPELIQQLIEYEQTKVHLERRRGAKDELRRIIDLHIEENRR
jgi:hypothetical protein